MCRRRIVFGVNDFLPLTSISVADELLSDPDDIICLLKMQKKCIKTKDIYRFLYVYIYLGFSSIPTSLLDLIPDDVELVSISTFLHPIRLAVNTTGSTLENQGFVRIRHRCRGDGAIGTNCIFILFVRSEE